MSSYPIYRSRFTTPFDQHAHREGERFIVLAVIDTPDDQHDEECLPMYLIRFASGDVIEAWPEEVTTNVPGPRCAPHIGIMAMVTWKAQS